MVALTVLVSAQRNANSASWARAVFEFLLSRDFAMERRFASSMLGENSVSIDVKRRREKIGIAI